MMRSSRISRLARLAQAQRAGANSSNAAQQQIKAFDVAGTPAMSARIAGFSALAAAGNKRESMGEGGRGIGRE